MSRNHARKSRNSKAAVWEAYFAKFHCVAKMQSRECGEIWKWMCGYSFSAMHGQMRNECAYLSLFDWGNYTECQFKYDKNQLRWNIASISPHSAVFCFIQIQNIYLNKFGPIFHILYNLSLPIHLTFFLTIFIYCSRWN